MLPAPLRRYHRRYSRNFDSRTWRCQSTKWFSDFLIASRASGRKHSNIFSQKSGFILSKNKGYGDPHHAHLSIRIVVVEACPDTCLFATTTPCSTLQLKSIRYADLWHHDDDDDRDCQSQKIRRVDRNQQATEQSSGLQSCVIVGSS